MLRFLAAGPYVLVVGLIALELLAHLYGAVQ